MSQPSSSRKASAALGWFPLEPASEASVIDVADARTLALRHRLRLAYWLNGCKPLTEVAVRLQRRKLTSIDPRDELTDSELGDLLDPHYGFAPTADGVGWHIPDLDDHYAHALAVIRKKSEAGKASGEARKAPASPRAEPQGQRAAPQADDPDDF
jgi:hypothetical protein